MSLRCNKEGPSRRPISREIARSADPQSRRNVSDRPRAGSHAPAAGHGGPAHTPLGGATHPRGRSPHNHPRVRPPWARSWFAAVPLPHEPGLPSRGRRRHRAGGLADAAPAARARVSRARGGAVRLGALGRAGARGRRDRRRRSDRPGARRGRHPGLRSGALLRRGVRLGRVGAPLCRRGGRGGRQLLALADARRGAARGGRGQSRRARRAPRDCLQPQLLHDAGGRRAGAAARRGRHRAARDLDLPGGIRHRQGCRGRAARPVPRAAARARARAARRVRPPHRVQRAPPRRLVRRPATTTPTRSASSSTRPARSSATLPSA